MKKHEVKSVVCDYGVFYDDKLIVILNSYKNAIEVCRILNEDMYIVEED